MSAEARAVRIVSDGTPDGTRITADGVELAGAVSVAWRIDVDNIATATVEFALVEVDVVGEVAES